MLWIFRFMNIDQVYLARQMKQYFKLLVKYSTATKILNVIQCEYALFRKKPLLNSMPYIAKLEPTNICNIDCAFCYRKQVKYGFGSASFEDFKRMFDPLRRYLCGAILHHLGEPLLNKDICKIISYVHRNKVATYVSTNLNYLTDTLAANLVKSGLDVLSVSVDGITPEVYSKYRKGGDFSILMQNLKKIVEQKKKLKSKTPFIDLQFIIFKYNEHQIEGVKKLAREIGVDSLKLRPGIVDDADWLPENKKLRSKLYVNRRCNKKACWWLWRTTHITWNGYVLPCCRVLCNKPFGNVFKEDFRKIWNNEYFVKARKCFSSDAKIDSQCYSCEIPYGNIHG